MMTLCVLMFVACGPESTPQPEPEPQPEAEFTITSNDEFSLEYEGGEITVTYDIVNPIEGVSVEATPMEDWIVETSAEEGSFTFAISENTTGKTRNANIKLTYDGANVLVNVMQYPCPTFALVAETIEVDAKGGDVDVVYEWNHTPQEDLIEVTSSVDWIVVEAVHKISTRLVVAENTANEPRSATVRVAYLDSEATVTINQAGVPIPEVTYTELPYLSGVYFDNQYGATESDYNYSLTLSTNDNCVDIVTGEITLLENSTYLFLDLYASEPAENLNVRFNVPVGEYTLDVEDSAVAGTIGAYYSSLYITDDVEGQEIFFVEGSVTVTAEGIEAKLYDDAGNEYHYFCPQTVVDNSDNFGPAWAPAEQSTLTGDLNVEFVDGAIYAECYGDYYVIGKNTWMYFVDDYATGDSFCFELLADVDAEYPVGTFPISNDLNNAQMALPGYVNSDGNTMWSWYSLYDDHYDVVGAAPIVGGEVDITDNGDDTFTVTINVVDDLGYEITGECVAYGEFYGTRANAPRRVLHSRK